MTNKIQKENILIDLDAINKEDVIKQVSLKLCNNGYISNIDLFEQDVFEREQYMKTGIGNHLAIPHGKSEAVNESTFAVAKLKRPIEWSSLDPLDHKPVDYVFLLAIKKADEVKEYLRFLADLSINLIDSFVEKIWKNCTQHYHFKRGRKLI